MPNGKEIEEKGTMAASQVKETCVEREEHCRLAKRQVWRGAASLPLPLTALAASVPTHAPIQALPHQHGAGQGEGAGNQRVATTPKGTHTRHLHSQRFHLTVHDPQCRARQCLVRYQVLRCGLG